MFALPGVWLFQAVGPRGGKGVDTVVCWADIACTFEFVLHFVKLKCDMVTVSPNQIVIFIIIKNNPRFMWRSWQSAMKAISWNQNYTKQTNIEICIKNHIKSEYSNFTVELFTIKTSVLGLLCCWSQRILRIARDQYFTEICTFLKYSISSCEQS